MYYDMCERAMRIHMYIYIQYMYKTYVVYTYIINIYVYVYKYHGPESEIYAVYISHV